MSDDEKKVEHDDASEERKAPRADKLHSDLESGLNDLGRLARGLAGKVVGPRADPLRPEGQSVVSPEVDQTLEGVGNTLGHWLKAAGEAMNENPDAPNKAIDETLEKGREAQIEERADEEGWSPLVQGARVFSEGLGQVTASLLDSLVAETGRKRPGAEEE